MVILSNQRRIGDYDGIGCKVSCINSTAHRLVAEIHTARCRRPLARISQNPDASRYGVGIGFITLSAAMVTSDLHWVLNIVTKRKHGPVGTGRLELNFSRMVNGHGSRQHVICAASDGGQPDDRQRGGKPDTGRGHNEGVATCKSGRRTGRRPDGHFLVDERQHI